MVSPAASNGSIPTDNPVIRTLSCRKNNTFDTRHNFLFEPRSGATVAILLWSRLVAGTPIPDFPLSHIPIMPFLGTQCDSHAITGVASLYV